MDRKEELHYHIHWSGKAALDWEAFGSRGDAEASAKQLVRLGETYIIEEQNENCSRCRDAFKLETEHAQAFKYSWQQLVSDAFQEARPEFVAWKVNAVQRAISARLCDNTPTDLDEQIAIREALQILQAIIPQPRKESDKNESGGKKATA